MKKKPSVIYYEDELNDEFADDDIRTRYIDGSYRYIREDPIGKLAHVFWYRMIAIPLAKLYMKLYFGHRVVGRERLRAFRGKGYFMYGNHTHFLADALVPTMVNMPKEVSVIVHPNNVSMPILGRITPSLGALPLPDDAQAARNFMRAVAHRIERGGCVMIYPEAHIWPYYTDIRPFDDTSFRYPVKYGAPVFGLTNTYQKRKHGKRPRLVTYIDGPFYPEGGLPAREQKERLRGLVYAAMKERAKNSNIEVIHYEKKK